MSIAEHVNTGLRWAVMMAVVFLVCYLYKTQERVSIERNDPAIDLQKLPDGSYCMDTAPYRTDDVQPGDLVAYYVPGSIEKRRVGWIVATPGQKIAIDNGDVKVDEQPWKFKCADSSAHFKALVVPRGCVYVLQDFSRDGLDSVKIGPLPFYCVLGKVKL